MTGETEQNVSGWTTDTLRSSVQQQVDDMRRMLQERYETQTKAVDAAFLAQQTAMQTALTAAERAVQTALLAAEKAVAKAEIAADKRFDSVNEFRAQLADQAATLMPRKEVEALFAEQIRQLAELRAGMADMRTLIAVGPVGLQAQVTTAAGIAAGRTQQEAAGFAHSTQMTTVLALIVSVLILAVGAYAATH